MTPFHQSQESDDMPALPAPIDADAAVRLLNSMLVADPTATHALLINRVPTNQALLDHPSVICDLLSADSSRPVVGLLGVLNGLLLGAGSQDVVAFVIDVETRLLTGFTVVPFAPAVASLPAAAEVIPGFPFTVDDFLTAYRETGLTPIHDRFFARDDSADTMRLTCGCPVTTLISHRFPRDLPKLCDGGDALAAASQVLGVERGLLSVFIDGIDFGRRRDECLDPIAEAAYQRGVAVWQAAQAAFAKHD